MEPMALAHRGFARRDMDSRWPRSHIGRSARRNLDAARDAWINRYAGRRERDLLSYGRRNRRVALWLRHGPIWPKEIVLHNSRRLSNRHRVVRIFLGLRQLRVFPWRDWSRHRGR